MYVAWGYTGKSVTYHFVSNCGTEISDITSSTVVELPIPEKEGCVFVGWYTSSDFVGNAVGSFAYYNYQGATLYAKWLDTADQSNGLEIIDGVITGVGTCCDV